MIKVKICTCAEKIPDFFSWRIMRALNFSASHVFIVYKDEIFHAVERGVCREPFGNLRDAHYLPDEIELNVPCTEQEFYDWFKGVEGIQYSFVQFGGFISTVPFIKNLFRNKRKGAVCSEFVAWFLEDLMKWPLEDSEFMSPKDVINFVKKTVGLTVSK